MNAVYRKISRIARLQDYTGRPDNLEPLLEEIAAKGYHAVALRVDQNELDPDFIRLCNKASSVGLSVCVGTGYMNMEWEHLRMHPDQKMVPMPNSGAVRKELGGPEGCPFNPDYKARYLKLLNTLARVRGVVVISINDEGSMPMREGCFCDVCRSAYREEFGKEMPVKPDPDETAWQDPGWRVFLKWRIDRWNAVHAEIRDFIKSINPDIKVLFAAGAWEVDLRKNPWYHAVDLSSMIDSVDGVLTDPYHTFGDHPFNPRETYLSEWSRFLAGIVPETKCRQIVQQGFSHPTFTRPLGLQDGYWTALIPPACGSEMSGPYSYTLQRYSPAQKTYEACMALDPYFEKTAPLKYAGLVHGAQTEIFVRPLPISVPDSYDGTRLMPLAESLRNHGTPYGFVSDRRLHLADIGDFKTLVIPEIAALSDEQMEAIRRHIDGGGNAVILGQLGSTDQTGNAQEAVLLEELTGIVIEGEVGDNFAFDFDESHPAASGLQLVDAEIADRYLRGAWKPCWRLAHCMKARVPETAKVLATFIDDGVKGLPAIVQCGAKGKVIWWAGFPTRTAFNPRFHVSSRNVAYLLFAAMVEWTAGGPAQLSVDGWPPETPMKRLRPLDPRFMSSFEFFPLMGQDMALGLVVSYFAEPAEFFMVFDVPDDRGVRSIRELINGAAVSFENREGKCRILVKTGFDTPALLFCFELM